MTIVFGEGLGCLCWCCCLYANVSVRSTSVRSGQGGAPPTSCSVGRFGAELAGAPCGVAAGRCAAPLKPHRSIGSADERSGAAPDFPGGERCHLTPLLP